MMRPDRSSVNIRRALVAVARKQMGAKLARRVDPEDIVQSTYRSLFTRVQNGEYDLGGGEDLWKLLVTIALNKVRRKSKFHRAAKRDMNMDRSVATDAGSKAIRDVRSERQQRKRPNASVRRRSNYSESGDFLSANASG